MRAPELRQDEAALERLREHEAALTHRLATARAEAAQVRAEAEAKVAALRAEAARQVEEEVAAAASDAARKLELELAARREEARLAVERTRQVPSARREEALRYVVQLASGGGP
jgi:hypothetical protein